MSSSIVSFTSETNLSFIHISKTGGSWTKRVLRKVQEKHQSNPLPIPPCDRLSPSADDEEGYEVGLCRIRSIDLDIPSHYPIDPKLVKLMGFRDRSVSAAKQSGIRSINKRQKSLKTIRFANIRNPYDMLGSMFLSNRRTMTRWSHNNKKNKAKLRLAHESLSRPDPAEGFPVFCYSFMDPQRHWIHPGYNRDDHSYPFGRPANQFLYWWLFDSEGKPTVDFVIRTERLTEGIQELLNQITVSDSGDTFSAEHARWSTKEIQNTTEDTGRVYRYGVDTGKSWSLNDRRHEDIKPMYDWLETHHAYITDVDGEPMKRSTEVRSDLDKRFQRECDAMGYTFDGPTDDAIFLDISGLRYHAKEDRLEILYPIRPCTIEFKE